MADWLRLCMPISSEVTRTILYIYEAMVINCTPTVADLGPNREPGQIPGPREKYVGVGFFYRDAR